MTGAGVITQYPDPAVSHPDALTLGPDGAIWFTTDGGLVNNMPVPASIGRITTAGVITNYQSPVVAGALPGITTGPDGALWFTEQSGPYLPQGDVIGRITTTGTVSVYPWSGIIQPGAIVAAPDGSLWFTNLASVAKVTTASAFSTVTATGPTPSNTTSMALAADPSGSMWYADPAHDAIIQIPDPPTTQR